MSIQFTHNQVLEDQEEARRKELEKLTGCPVAKIIDGTCQDPECQKGEIYVNGMLMDEETCSRLQEVVFEGKVSESRAKTHAMSSKTPAPIIQTEKRLRCGL